MMFRNKTDIYRNIAFDMLTLSAAQAKAELDKPGPFAERMERAVDMAIISMIASFSTTPHGAEFLDMKSGLSDLIGTWRGQLLDHMTKAIALEGLGNGVDLAEKGLPAPMLADALLDRLDGIKARTIDPEVQRQAARVQIMLINGVLQA